MFKIIDLSIALQSTEKLFRYSLKDTSSKSTKSNQID